MTFEECPKCHLPVAPTASESMKQMQVVCTCGSTMSAIRPHSLAQPPQQAKGVPDLEGLYLDILAEYAPELPKPLRQQAIIPERGYTVDFFWPAKKGGLVVEIDGNPHRIKSRFQSDAEKHNLLILAGFTYLRFTGTMLRKQVFYVADWTRRGLEKAGK